VNATTSRPCPHVDDKELEATRAERRTRWVVGITALMMIAELVVGTLAKSLALVADGQARKGQTLLAPVGGALVPVEVTDFVLYDPEGTRRDG